jgi:hypothetical protein
MLTAKSGYAAMGRNDAQAAASVNTTMDPSKGAGKGNGADQREEGTGGGGAVFTRTSSAPAAIGTKSEKEEIDEIFKLVKRKSIACRVDRQWEDRSLDNSLRFSLLLVSLSFLAQKCCNVQKDCLELSAINL